MAVFRVVCSEEGGGGVLLSAGDADASKKVTNGIFMHFMIFSGWMIGDECDEEKHIFQRCDTHQQNQY